MKLIVAGTIYVELDVAPHAGAWIETCIGAVFPLPVRVAPHAGAWIETDYSNDNHTDIAVAPHAGAWIETTGAVDQSGTGTGRPPRGGVD